jgi:spermidine/putrescine transport system permease protein
VTYQVSYPVIIVRARILSIRKEYEEAAMDLGAPPREVIRRILPPLLYPAIFASFAIAFGSPTPAVNAAATLLLVTTTVAIVLGYFLCRRAARAQRTAGVFEFANV